MTKAELQRLRDRIDRIANDVLCDMKPGWDDSIEGFNQAWGLVRDVFKEEIDRTDHVHAEPQRSVASEHPISQGMLRTQEIMCAADMEAKIAALAHRFWSIHPSSLDDMGLTREEFYAREMRKLLSLSHLSHVREANRD